MVLLVMGVSGSGKTTVGQLLAHAIGWEFADADAYHPKVNIAKMQAGIPLTDEDRAPWLATLTELIQQHILAEPNLVLACSALKKAYRDELAISPEVRVIYLRGSYDLIESRLLARSGHYMHANMLRSQFEALEEPTDAIVVDIDAPPEAIVLHIRQQLGL